MGLGGTLRLSARAWKDEDEDGLATNEEDVMAMGLDEAKDLFRQTKSAKAARRYMLAAYDYAADDMITWNEFLAVVVEIGGTQIVCKQEHKATYKGQGLRRRGRYL